MEIRKAMRIARKASLAYFHPRRFAERYRRKRRLSAAPDDPVLMFSRERPARSTGFHPVRLSAVEMPRFRCPSTTAPIRSAGFFSSSDGCNIASGTDPATRTVTEDFRNFAQRFSGAAFCCRRTTASCTFVRQTAFCPTKVLALRGRAFSRVERLFNRYYEYRPKKNTTSPNSEL